MKKLVLLLLAVPCLGVTCGPAVGAPEPDECAAPGQEPISSLEIGPPADGFTAWADPDTATVTYGDQGGAMLGVRLRIGGERECLAQRTTILQEGRSIAYAETPVNTYPGDDGMRTTQTIWVVFGGTTPYAGQEIEVVTEAGGLSAGATLAISQ